MEPGSETLCRSRGAVQFHLKKLQVTPGEGGQEMTWGLAVEVAVRTGVRFGPGWYRVLGIEGDVRRRVPDEDPVALRRFGHHQRQPRQMQRCEVEAGIEPQVGALGQ